MTSEKYTFRERVIMRELFTHILKHARILIFLGIIALLTGYFSVTSILTTEASNLRYSFPDANVDYSTISWAEFPIDENGHSFEFTYPAWDIGQLGIRISYESITSDSSFALIIQDAEKNEHACEYRIEDLFTDEDGTTWLNVEEHVSAGDMFIQIKNINTNGLKVIGYSQEGILDENGNAKFNLNMKINAASFPKEKAYLFSIGWILVFLLLFMFLTLKPQGISYEKLFILIYLSVGILGFFVYPPFAEPDSGNHYRRAYAISEGIIFPELDENNAIGGQFAWPSTWGSEDSIGVSWYEAENRMAFNVNDSENQQYLTYTNIALYSPISHIIPAVGMSVTRLFSHSIIVIEMVAKILNYLAIGIVLYLGIKIAPFGKQYFLWTILNPFVIKQYTSISPDLMVVALVYLLTALVLRLRYDQNAYAEKGYLVSLYMVSFLLGQYKIVYVAFCLLLFLIPVKKFKGTKKYIIHASAIATVTLIPVLLWLKISSHILSLGYSEINTTNTKIVMDIGKYIPILLNTFMQRAHEYIMTIFGYTLVFKVGTNMTIVVFFMLFVALVIGILIQKNHNNPSPIAIEVNNDRLLKIILFSTMLVTAVLIFTAEYIQWTDPGALIVNGVSGRYFFSFFYPALIFLTGTADKKLLDDEKITYSEYKTLFSLAAFALCFVAQLYVVYQL